MMDKRIVMEQRKGYKKTELGWIPIEWEVVKLGSVTKIYGGGTPSTKELSFWENGTIYWATPTDFTKRKGNYILETDLKITQKAIDENNINVLKAGSVIMSSRATIGECKINRDQITINQGFASFECDNTLLNLYLLYLIKYLKREILRLSSGSTFLEVNKSSLRNLEILLPPLIEQKKIATILSAVDEKLDAIEQRIAETETLKKGLVQHLLTTGIGHNEFKESELGWIPKKWEIAKLGDITEIIGGGTPSTKESSFWENGTIYWATPTDFTKRKGNYIIETDLKITKKAIEDNNIYLLKVGSVIMSSRATIGECKINLNPIATNQGFASFECKDSLFNLFLLFLIKYLKKEILRLASGTTFLEISKYSLRSFKVPLPPLPEQQKIAAILSTVDEKIECLQDKKAVYQTLKKGLLHQLLTGALRVTPAAVEEN